MPSPTSESQYNCVTQSMNIILREVEQWTWARMHVRPHCRPRKDEEERGSLMALMSFQFVFYEYEDNVMVLLKLFYFKLTQ